MSDLLNKTLRQKSRRVLAGEAVAAMGTAGAGLIGAGLLAVALDAALSLPVWALVVIDGLLLVVAGVSAGYLGLTIYRHQYNPRRIARRIERRMRWSHSGVINAVDLSQAPALGTSDALRELAVDRGTELAASAPAQKVVDTQRARRRGLWAAGAAGIAILAYLAVPGVFHAVLPRLLDPASASPPFTVLRFDVRIEPQRVYRGRSARIVATISGPTVVPKQANVVFLDEAGRASHTLPMLRDEPGRFVLDVEQAERSRWFYVDTPAGRSEKVLLTVLEVPVFRRVEARYEFPPYTNPQQLGRAVVTPSRATLRALRDTHITLRVTSNLPLEKGTLTVVAVDGRADTVPLLPGDDPRVVEGTFQLTGSGSYSIMLTSNEGVQCNEPFRGKVVCVEDELPKVEITSPGASVVVPENWAVAVAVRARDDVGIAGIGLLRSINGWGPTGTALPLDRANATDVTAEYLFDLPGLGAKAGDVITYFASARDVHPSAEHFQDSATHVIRVISEEEYNQIVRSRYRMKQIAAEIQRFLDMLAEIEQLRAELREELAALQAKMREAGGALSEADRSRLHELAAQQAKYADALAKAAEHLRERMDQPTVWGAIEEDLKQQLANVAESLEGRARANKGMANAVASRAPSGPSAEEAEEYLQTALLQLGKPPSDAQEQLALSEKEFDLLHRADVMTQLVQQLDVIAKRQRDLADRLGQFRNRETLNSTEQIRAQRLAREQAELEVDLKHLLASMVKAAQRSHVQLPKMSASVLELADAVVRLGVLDDQHDAAILADAGQGRYAHRAADSAASKLEALYEECCGGEGPGDMALDDLDRALSLKRSQLQSLMQQLLSTGTTGMGTGQGGYYGSAAPVSLLGPHSLQGEGEPKPTTYGGGGEGDTVGLDDPGSIGDGPESLRPTQIEDVGDVRAGSGVPLRYRGLVEAYFRRLADESK